MLEDLQIRRYSPTTIRLYLCAVEEFAKDFREPPDQLAARHTRRYQSFRKVAVERIGSAVRGSSR
jgi:hypothetical protein